MTVHISFTTGCNLGCTYCYENPERERKQEWVDRQYDMDAVIERLENWKEKYPHETPGLHGGEPLLVRNEDLRTIYQWIWDNYEAARTGEDPIHTQTNGTLIDDEIVGLFEEFNVSVGISMDGPPELNSERKAAGERDDESGRATAKMSERTDNALKRLVEHDSVGVGVITVLHETNAGTEDDFERLLEWMDWLCYNGTMGHFNPAIPYEEISPEEDLALDPETLKERYLRAWKWMKAEDYRTWNPMADYVDNLLGNSRRNCVNNKCDPANAGAAKITKGDGSTSGCGKTWSAYGDGGAFLQGPSTGNEYNGDQNPRYDALEQVPGKYTSGDAPDMGGCLEDPYYQLSTGGCPAAGMNYDWRNRSIWSPAKYALYEAIEDDIRALFPNVTLVTDYPWDVEVGDLAASWQADIEPFAGIRPGESGRSSAQFSNETSAPSKFDRVPDEAFPNDSDFERQVRQFRDEYPEEHVTVDREDGMIHADSDAPTEPATTPDEA